MNQAINYARIKITGILTCQSDLHIGDGDLDIFKDRETNRKKTERANQENDEKRPIDMKGSFNTVCLNHQKKPYIPGSTLRGSLTAFLERTDKDTEEDDEDTDIEIIKKLFGYEIPATETELAKRSAGKVRIYDAHFKKSIRTNDTITPYWDENRHTLISHGIALDPVTGTTEKNKLFRYELVPASTEFTVEIEADNLDKEEIAKLLGLLQRWQGNADTAIGKGTSKGYGRIKWNQSKTCIKALTHENLTSWLNDADADKPPYTDITTEITADTSLLKNSHTRYEFTINIFPQSPLLCNEPGFVTDDKKDPKQLYYKRNDKAIIPGTTLAGVFRAQGRKILMTLLHQADTSRPLNEIADQAEKMIGQLFGNQDQKSAIEFSEAIEFIEATDPAEKKEEHEQYFTAIDRFTGGVKDGALFNVVAAQCTQLNAKNCYLNINRMPEGDWWKGLLLFIARDAIEGDLNIGWGKSKGYGNVLMQLNCNNTPINSAEKLHNILAEKLGKDNMQHWIEALLVKTGNLTPEEQADE